MIKYVATKPDSAIIKVNFEEQTATREGFNGNVDCIYVIHEDGEWVVDNDKLFDVKKGDVIIKMYSSSEIWKDKEYIKLNSPELIDYYERLKAFRESSISNKPSECCNNCNCICKSASIEA